MSDIERLIETIWRFSLMKMLKQEIATKSTNILSPVNMKKVIVSILMLNLR